MLKKIVTDYRFVSVLWFGLVLATIMQNVFIRGQFNNYLIFDGVSWHTPRRLPLYVAYPEEYFDTNYHGSFFGLIIVPSATLPKRVGCSFWITANAAFLYWVIRQLPLPKSVIIEVLLVVARDMYIVAAMQQFNINIIAFSVGASAFI